LLIRGDGSGKKDSLGKGVGVDVWPLYAYSKDEENARADLWFTHCRETPLRMKVQSIRACSSDE
jgi:hypothetical protein